VLLYSGVGWHSDQKGLVDSMHEKHYFLLLSFVCLTVGICLMFAGVANTVIVASIIGVIFFIAGLTFGVLATRRRIV